VSIQIDRGRARRRDGREQVVALWPQQRRVVAAKPEQEHLRPMPLRLHRSPLPPASSGRPRHTYAFSFDRETFRGSYETRSAAVEAGEQALAAYPGPAEAIWVARAVRPEPRLNGLAETVLEALADRMSDEGQDAVQASELARDELDARMAALLHAWMRDHDLFPAGGVEAVSEHPIRLIPHVDDEGTAGKEVSLIGEVGEVG
jgi:hypothetical protein